MGKGWFLNDILYVKRGGILKPKKPDDSCTDAIQYSTVNTESPKLYGPSKEYLDFMNTPKKKFDNVIYADFKNKKRLAYPDSIT